MRMWPARTAAMASMAAPASTTRAQTGEEERDGVGPRPTQGPCVAGRRARLRARRRAPRRRVVPPPQAVQPLPQEDRGPTGHCGSRGACCPGGRAGTGPGPLLTGHEVIADSLLEPLTGSGHFLRHTSGQLGPPSRHNARSLLTESVEHVACRLQWSPPAPTGQGQSARCGATLTGWTGISRRVHRKLSPCCGASSSRI